jgi:hypothetical protein
MCSLACSKKHKETPCEKADTETHTQSQGTKRGRQEQPDIFPTPSSLARRHHHQQMNHSHTHIHTTQAEDEEEDFPILTEEMRKALLESKWLRTALQQDSTLCSLLTDIDTHKQRGAKLREALSQYPDFQGFVDRVLLEIGALKYEEGRLVFSDETA